MEFKILGKWFPEEGRKILVAYETEDLKLKFKILKYDGYLTHSPEMKSFVFWTYIDDQPERSKREDSQECEMRCSEHCGNTMRDK